MNKLAELFSPVSSLTFIGNFNELPKTAHTGDLCVVNNKEYVYGLGWNEIEILVSDSYIENGTLYLT